MADLMTLEDVRDWHRGCEQAANADGHTNAASAHKELADAIDAAIKQRERDANNPLKGWIFDKVNMGRGDERYKQRAETAEAELAALKARIAESAHLEVTLGCAIDGEIPPDLALCKVALVKMENDDV